MKYSSKETVWAFFVPTYDAVCRFLSAEAKFARAGFMRFDGWSAALGGLLIGVTKHFVGDEWLLRFIPIATLNTGIASKSGKQLR